VERLFSFLHNRIARSAIVGRRLSNGMLRHGYPDSREAKPPLMQWYRVHTDFVRTILRRGSHRIRADPTTSTPYDAGGNAYLTTAYDNTGFNNFMSTPLSVFPAQSLRQTATRFDNHRQPCAVRDAARYVSLTEYNAAGHVNVPDDARDVRHDGPFQLLGQPRPASGMAPARIKTGTSTIKPGARPGRINPISARTRTTIAT
jgi:hypothetical protein